MTREPTIVHACEQRALKSEDVIYLSPSGGEHKVFLVCDGHGGPDVAQSTAELLPQLLIQRLPAELPDFGDRAAVEAYAERLRSIIADAVVACDTVWAQTDGCSGSTLTLAVISGWLLTLANCGDSNAIVDTGNEVFEMTHSHRIQGNIEEQQRLRRSGARLAPLAFHLQGPAKAQELGVGPLRLWPGGLCISRSIGDVDSGPLVVPLPHIRQLLLPRDQGLRLIMASDGLWDLVEFAAAARTSRSKLPHQAVASLVETVVRDRRMADDVSIIIADFLPDASRSFPDGTSRLSGTDRPSNVRKGRSGGLFSCFGGGAQPEGAAELAPGSTTLDLIADVDCLQAYPHLCGRLVGRTSPAAAPRVMRDITVHGRRTAQWFAGDNDWHMGSTDKGRRAYAGSAARHASAVGKPEAAM